MKNTILIAFFCLFALTALAQPRIGFKGGLNYSSLSGYDGDRLLSFHGGIFSNKSISKNWRIQPELTYSGEGQKFATDGGEQTLAMHFIAAPVMLQYFPSGRFYLEAGPQLAVLVSAQSKESGTHLNLRRSFRSTDFGFELGAGFAISSNMGLYGRYHFGLTDMSLFDSDADKVQSARLGILVNLKNSSKSKEK